MRAGQGLLDASAALTIAVVAIVAMAAGIATPLERLAGDALVRLAATRPPPPPSDRPDVVIVAIDPQSLRTVPEWPWSRRLFAETTRRLDAAGALAIAFDIDFSTARDPDADAAFAAAVADAGNVVLAAFRQVQELPGGAELEITNLPAPALAEAAAALGSVQMPVDPDGILRRAPRATRIGGRDEPSLAAATLDVAMGARPGRAPAGAFPIDFRRVAPAVRVLPIIDVIEGRFDPRDVAGRAVLVGATSVEFQDLWSTPLGPARPGVWIQAIALRTLAAERAGDPTLTRVSLAGRAALVLLLAAAAAALGRRSHARRLAALGGLVAGVLAGCLGLLVGRGLLLEPVVPLAVLAAQYVLGLERVRRRFGRRLAERELSLSTLHRVGEATASPAGGEGLDVALSLLGDVIDARGVSLLRASPGQGLDGRRLDWHRRGTDPIGDVEAAANVLEARQARIYQGPIPGRDAARGLAVYSPLYAGDVPVGVLVVERDGEDPLDETQLRTVSTVGAQLALSAENLRLLEGLRATFDSSIEAIATAVEARDGYTESHCRRLATFSTLMACQLGLGDAEIEAIRLGALLHDVGKIGIRDEILLKRGRFSPSERDAMRAHASLGHRIISGIHGLGTTTLACVRHHHERWDGGGYPDGLRGEQTPLGARIVAVVDVWDALSTARPYKPAFEQDRVREILRKGRGDHFDPMCVDLFLQVLDEEGEDLLVQIEGPGGAAP